MLSGFELHPRWVPLFDGNSSFEISYGRTDNVARVQLNVYSQIVPSL